jgi:hypothetical protein
MSSGTVVMKLGPIPTIIFKDTNTTNTSTLVDKDGNELDWSILKENDVLSVQRVKGNSSGRVVNVCIYVDNVIEGTVRELSPSGDDTEYTINGTSYKVDNQVTMVGDLALEDEGEFHLDVLGRIAYFDISSSASGNYAYILAVGSNGGVIDSGAQIKLFTYAGEIVLLDTAQKVKVYYNDADGDYINVSVESEEFIELVEATNKDERFVTFGVNGQGKVNKISYPNKNESGNTNAKTFSQYATTGTSSEANYDGERARFSIGGKTVYVDDSSIIMQAPQISNSSGYNGAYVEDNYELISVSALKGDQEGWTLVSAYDVDNNRTAKVVLVEGECDFASAENGVALVQQTSETKNARSDTVIKLTALQNGEITELIGTENATSVLEEVSLGDVIVPTFNGANEIKDIVTVATLASNKHSVTFDAASASQGKVMFTAGQVTERRSNRISIGAADFIIPASANIYVYNERGSKPGTQVFEPDERYAAFSVSKLSNNTLEYFDADGERINPVQMLVREYDGDVVDVIFYLFRYDN